jgi:hypothetical protein
MDAEILYPPEPVTNRFREFPTGRYATRFRHILRGVELSDWISLLLSEDRSRSDWTGQGSLTVNEVGSSIPSDSGLPLGQRILEVSLAHKDMEAACSDWFANNTCSSDSPEIVCSTKGGMATSFGGLGCKRRWRTQLQGTLCVKSADTILPALRQPILRHERRYRDCKPEECCYGCDRVRTSANHTMP